MGQKGGVQTPGPPPPGSAHDVPGRALRKAGASDDFISSRKDSIISSLIILHNFQNTLIFENSHHIYPHQHEANLNMCLTIKERSMCFVFLH